MQAHALALKTRHRGHNATSLPNGPHNSLGCKGPFVLYILQHYSVRRGGERSENVHCSRSTDRLNALSCTPPFCFGNNANRAAKLGEVGCIHPSVKDHNPFFHYRTTVGSFYGSTVSGAMVYYSRLG